MNLHEYQGKEILASHGVKIQRGYVAETSKEALEAFKKLKEETGTEIAVIKAQIHAGGRGKGGGVKLAKNEQEVEKISGEILGMMLKTPQTPGGLEGPGKLVSKVLVAEDSYAPDFDKCKEFYVSVMLDREKKCNVIIYSTEGGMNIEEVAEATPHLVHKEWIDPELGIQGFQLRKIAFNLGLSGAAFKDMTKFIAKLYTAFLKSDSSLIEINPCLVSCNEEIIAVDTKFSVDENALFRHPDIAAMRDTSEEDPTDVEAKEFGLNFVKLDGNVGCMVNGAGLAMATMDIIKLSGGSPANFLDVGGTADAERVENAFKIILKDPNVKAILINIFGGIVRCDRVANGVVDAYKNMGNINVPIIVRLQGTNAELAKEIIDKSGLEVKSAILLQEAADLVKEVVGSEKSASDIKAMLEAELVEFANSIGINANVNDLKADTLKKVLDKLGFS